MWTASSARCRTRSGRRRAERRWEWHDLPIPLSSSGQSGSRHGRERPQQAMSSPAVWQNSRRYPLVSAYHALGRALSGGPWIHRGRRGPHPPAHGRAGHEHRHPGRVQPGLEARPGRSTAPRRRRCWTATRPNGGPSARRSSHGPGPQPKATGAKPAASRTAWPTRRSACPTEGPASCETTEAARTPCIRWPGTARPTSPDCGGGASASPCGCSTSCGARSTSSSPTCRRTDASQVLADLADFAREVRPWLGTRLRVVAIAAAHDAEDQPGIALHHDRQGGFAEAYGAQAASFLVRPDGHLGWRGRSWRGPGLLAHLEGVFRPAPRPGHAGEAPGSGAKPGA